MVHPIGLAALVSGVTAQILKPFIDMLQRKGFHAYRLFDTGGMPSSHTAVVTTLTIGVAVYEGIGSPLFGISLIVSLYFIFEATGLRQEVGYQAKVLNEVMARAEEPHPFDAEALRELIGHTWIEVVAGLALGTVVALLMY